MKALLITLAGWFLLTTSAQAQSKTATTVVSSKTTNDIVGVWAFAGNVGQAASTDKKIKIILDKHWMFSQPDPTTNMTLFHHGGTYLLDGNNYAETIEYANESTGGLLNQTFRYEIEVKIDTMKLKGIGNSWSEVWKRIK